MTSSSNANTSRYSSLSITMHWLMVILIIATYLLIELRVLYPKGSDPREALKMWHFMVGLSMFALIWIRLIARWMGATPSISPTPPTWQTFLSQATHVFLYLFMLGMPLLGWLVLSAAGKPIPFALPALIAPDETLAKSLKELHEIIGTVGYYVIGLHTLGALFHHYISRDNTLIRMLPRPVST